MKEEILIIRSYKIKKRYVIIVCLISISIFAIVYTIQNQKKIKPGFIYTKNITSFKISNNIMGEEKEVTNSSDIEKIINLINSVKITESGVGLPAGGGYGVTLTYSNGEIYSASFLGGTMAYTNDNSTAVCCSIDKNIVGDLRAFYDETKVAGIDNTEKKINEVVPINYNDITKIVFTGNYNETIENKAIIKKIMSLIDGYVVKQEPQEFPIIALNISARFFIGNKEVMNIEFINPMRINGKSYEYKNTQLGDERLSDFLNSII